MSNKILENLTRNQYVGVGLAAVVVATALYFLLKKVASDTASGLNTLAKKTADATGIPQAFSALTDSAPDSSGASFSSWYDPTQRTVLFYWLTFPDGASHFIGAGSVNSDATFDYDGTSYRIGNSKAGDLRAYLWEGGWG